MSKLTMAKLPGLFLREGVYQLRVMVPKDLSAAYGGKTRLTYSLTTGNHREASLRGAAKRAEVLAEFDRKRKELAPQRLDKVSPELARQLAERIAAGVLGDDDKLRDDPKHRAIVLTLDDAVSARGLAALTIGGKPVLRHRRPAASMAESLAGITEQDAEQLVQLNASISSQAAGKLARRDRAAILPIVEREARKLGFLFDPAAPGAPEALLEALQAFRRAWLDVTRRDAGEAIETPAPLPAVRAGTGKAMRLREVYERWKASSVDRSADSIAACGRALALYEQSTEDPPLPQLTREQGDAFRAFLLKQGTTAKTAHDRLTWVKSLLKYAKRDLRALSEHPWEGLDVAYPKRGTKPRKPWSDAELSTLFAHPLFTRYELPQKQFKSGGAAAYWLPLLALYTGARVGELAQLRVQDVETAGSVPVLSITDEGEDQRVKTEAGIRRVPVHSELIRLGFLDYVAAMRATKQDRLWPEMRFRKDKPGAYFSDWFGTFRKTLDPVPPDFHSMRHTVRTRLREAGVEKSYRDLLIGHETAGEGATYEHATDAELKREVERLQYPSLKLHRVYGQGMAARKANL
jgi:integrase